MTAQPEEKADTDLQAEPDYEDLKYIRTGYQDLGRKADFFLKDMLLAIPGDGKLPAHWHYRSIQHFLKKYGHLGAVIWAPASNSHLLLINGQRAIRIWMDVASTCWIDINDSVDAQLQFYSWGQTQAIPAGNSKKSKPFTKRIKVSTRFQMQDVAKAVKRAYGLDIARLLVHKF